MDYLRSAYTARIYSFDPASGTIVMVPITWYRSPIGATRIGVRHQYSSQNWTRPVQYGEMVGELLMPNSPWSNGATPPNLLGTGHCGADQLWRGPLARLTSPLTSHPDGQPSCCPESSSGVPCAGCVGGTGQTSYMVTASGGTVDFAGLNGSYSLSNTATCTWTGGSGIQTAQLTVAGGVGTLLLVLFPGFTRATYRTPAGWDCHAPTTWPLSSSSGSGVPPSVVVM
jgi:hypothetical protein